MFIQQFVAKKNKNKKGIRFVYFSKKNLLHLQRQPPSLSHTFALLLTLRQFFDTITLAVFTWEAW